MNPHSLAQHFATEAYNNAWANHRLLKACAQLTDAEFAAPGVSFFPSIKATLNHILTVDWFYVEMLERGREGLPPHQNPGRHFAPEEPFAACAALSKAQHESDRKLIAFCESLDDSRLDDPVTTLRSKGPVTDRVRRILAHLFGHQIHHRGQAHAMLAGTRVKPPQLDEFFCTGEAHLRAAEFAELGFTEERVWGSRSVAPA